jgi:glycerol-3-phosphate O-acyltransferase
MKASVPQRVATLNEQQILVESGFLREIDEISNASGKSPDQVLEYARTCLEEMAVHPEDRYLDRFARLARFLYTRSYEPELDVDAGELARLRELGREHPLVFLWSHKSYLDGFVFLRAIYDSDFHPQPLSFAGINMAFTGLKILGKRSGAIFLRRSFKDDEIYRLVFRHYIDYLVKMRVPLSWAIEGTRSRTGRLMPPKLGLMHWVIESYHRASCDDVLFVPVSISFDQIPEMDDLVAMQRGLPKRKESLRWFVGYISGMKAHVGRIHLRCGEPISLADASSRLEGMFDASGKPEHTQVRKLAFEVMSRIEHVTPILITDLVTLVLLAANGRALTKNQIRAHAQEVIALVRQRSLPMAGELSVESGAGLAGALTAMTATGLLHCYGRGSEPVYRVTPGNELAAAYYRNTIVHYFLASAVAEIALARICGNTESVAALHDAILSLRDLLKFEFFFRTKEDFIIDTDAYLDMRYPGWKEALAERRPAADILFHKRAPLFGHGVMRSFLEAYEVMARVLDRASQQDMTDEKDLIRLCMKQGEELLSCGRIHSASALSEPLFGTAMKLAVHRGLLAGNADDLAKRRGEFGAEISDAVHALNYLQKHYDRHQDQVSAC